MGGLFRGGGGMRTAMARFRNIDPSQAAKPAAPAAGAAPASSAQPAQAPSQASQAAQTLLGRRQVAVPDPTKVLMGSSGQKLGA